MNYDVYVKRVHEFINIANKFFAQQIEFIGKKLPIEIINDLKSKCEII